MATTLPSQELQPYIRARLAAMDIELLHLRGLIQAASTDPDLTPEDSSQVPSGPAAEAAPHPARVAPPAPGLYWLSVPDRILGRKRYLVEILGDGHARTSHKTGLLTPKVRTRTYLARPGRWAKTRLLKPAAWFTAAAAASPDDPFVRRALRRRPVTVTD